MVLRMSTPEARNCSISAVKLAVGSFGAVRREDRGCVELRLDQLNQRTGLVVGRSIWIGGQDQWCQRVDDQRRGAQFPSVIAKIGNYLLRIDAFFAAARPPK